MAAQRTGKLRIVNKTRWRTDDLARIARRAAKVNDAAR